MAETTKTCETCGAPFAASRSGYTVNCPAHRGRTTEKTATRKPDPKAPHGATCTVYPCTRPAVVRVPGTTDCFECAAHAPRGSF